jgi:hypothetical protein
MSMQRDCGIFKAVNNKWYLELGNREYSSWDDCTIYGPFESEEGANQELRKHSNPGSVSDDPSGTRKVPTKVVPPRRQNW